MARKARRPNMTQDIREQLLETAIEAAKALVAYDCAQLLMPMLKFLQADVDKHGAHTGGAHEQVDFYLDRLFPSVLFDADALRLATRERRDLSFAFCEQLARLFEPYHPLRPSPEGKPTDWSLQIVEAEEP